MPTATTIQTTMDTTMDTTTMDATTIIMGITTTDTIRVRTPHEETNNGTDGE